MQEVQEKLSLNGVNTPALLATINAVGEQPTHGLTDAFRDAALLANAVRAGTTVDMKLYVSTRDALSLPFLLATDALASLNWTPDAAQALHGRLRARCTPRFNCCSACIGQSQIGETLH